MGLVGGAQEAPPLPVCHRCVSPLRRGGRNGIVARHSPASSYVSPLVAFTHIALLPTACLPQDRRRRGLVRRPEQRQQPFHAGAAGDGQRAEPAAAE